MPLAPEKAAWHQQGNSPIHPKQRLTTGKQKQSSNGTLSRPHEPPDDRERWLDAVPADARTHTAWLWLPGCGLQSHEPGGASSRRACREACRKARAFPRGKKTRWISGDIKELPATCHCPRWMPLLNSQDKQRWSQNDEARNGKVLPARVSSCGVTKLRHVIWKTHQSIRNCL